MDVLQWSRHYRCFPGQGGLDVAAVLRETLAAGYAGPLSLEVFNDVFRAADPERMAVDAMRSLLILEDALPAPARARRLRVRRARARLDLRARDRGDARGARLHPHRPAPLQAGAAVGAGGRARRHQPRRGAGHAARRRARVRDARPRRRRGPRRGAAGARCCPSAGARTRPRCARSSPPTAPSVIFCRALASRLPAGRRAGGRAAARDRPPRAVAALRLLRRGGALLPLGARPAPARVARSSPRRTG